MTGYLLDTDHCIRILEGDPLVLKRVADLRGLIIATCIFVEGELRFMAINSERKETNLLRIDTLLRGVSVYEADRQAAEIYAQIKAAVLNRFGPRIRAERRKFRLESVGFRDNDLWIASVALRHDLTLVSADSDFERLAEVGDLNVEKWWSPSATGLA